MHPFLSAIGFVGTTSEDLTRLTDLAAHASRPVETRGGYCYLHWAGASGAEMWLQLSRDSKLIGLNPHFAGLGRMRVSLVQTIDREDATPLDQAYYAHAEPEPGDDHRTYSLVFDCPNPLTHPDLACPTVATVQLAAFPFHVELFPTVAEFEAKFDEGDGPPQPASLAPIGPHAIDGTELQAAEALAYLTGVVQQTAEHRNELTGEIFHWALIDCMRSSIDVVIDPRTVSAPPHVGGVVCGVFSLSGRFVDFEKRRGFFDRARGVG